MQQYTKICIKIMWKYTGILYKEDKSAIENFLQKGSVEYV